MAMAEKILARQDADFTINPGNNNETSIKITEDICKLFFDELPTEDKTKTNVSFFIYKEDFLKSACGILSSLPLLDKHGHPVSFSIPFCESQLSKINEYFGDDNMKLYNAELLYYTSSRNSCIQGFETDFNIRSYMVESWSKISFLKKSDGIHMRLIFKRSKEVPTDSSKSSEIPIQAIFYGAPGTGKSNTIKQSTVETEKLGRVFRTTFHPDSDYSTFVGCYKPISKNKEPIYKLGELINKLSEIKTTGATYPCHKFAAKYWESLNLLSASEVKQILSSCDFPESMYQEINKGIAVGEDLSGKLDNSKIVYSFVPQAFTKAYIKAWQTTERIYLIIEEINRGNCAQIFGDLFQLLDRKDGVSEYPIDADADLANYLAKHLADVTRTDIPEEVKKGNKLQLPSNLYIWATMNTSDQSLFPIDSAFKRRWDWIFIKIKNHPLLNYQIKIDGENKDWWGFIEKINQIIASITSSADKQLGYFFCKADANGEIDEKKFVSKVIFYLWNDVFKDYGFEDASLFRYKDEETGEEKDLTFPDFYEENGEDVNIVRLRDFIDKVMNWKKVKEENN